MKKYTQVASATLLAMGMSLVCANVEGAAEQRKGPLKDMPSEPQGEHLEKIKALGDNEWVELGAPAPDPEWGKACGRSWGGKAFVLAPDIRGAFFGGEGQHAFVKPNGYGMNDYWVYDINAHRWICIYPGVNTKDFSRQVKDGDLKVNEHGLVVDREGRLMPGKLIHAWGFFAYDTDRNRFASGVGTGYNTYFFPGTYKNPNSEDIKKALKVLQEEMKARNPAVKSPMFYDVVKGKFECYPASGKKSPTSGFPQFIYVPSIKQFFHFRRKDSSFYDPDKNVWTPVKVKGARMVGYDINACYDSKRDVIYSGKFGVGSDARKAAEKEGIPNAILVFDIQTKTWSQPDVKGKCPRHWSTNRCSVYYDSAGDVVVFLDYGEEQVYVYDPETGTWHDPTPMPEGIRKGRNFGNAFYDPELNVHFVLFSGDSRDNGVMWAYRYKRK